MRRTLLFLGVAAATIISCLSCRTTMRSTLPGPPTAAQLAELWFQPEPDRDLFRGVGGERLAPDPSAPYQVIAVKQGGFSRGLTVKDPAGREWSAKFPPEAAPEVVSSRVLWGAGFHQPPIYYVGEWNATGSPYKNPQQPARFRDRKPDFHGLDYKGPWSYYENPLVGTRELNGLLVLQVMLGNSDLKAEQNAIYELKEPVEGAARWYVAVDVGESWGRTGKLNPPRGDIQAFEETPFIKGLDDKGHVRFDYRGLHGDLVDHMTPEDVRWICERLQQLTDKQWSDAFRAAGYAPSLADRFIRRFKQKIQEGLALSRGGAPRR